MLSSVLLFLNIGGGEMVLIVFVALMLFGGEKLPELARGLGKGIRDFKDASEDVKREINNQINSYEKKTPEKPAEIETTIVEATEEKPETEGVEGTIAAYQGYAVATDAIEEPETEADDKAVAEDATYEHQPQELKHTEEAGAGTVNNNIDQQKERV